MKKISNNFGIWVDFLAEKRCGNQNLYYVFMWKLKKKEGINLNKTSGLEWNPGTGMDLNDMKRVSEFTPKRIITCGLLSVVLSWFWIPMKRFSFHYLSSCRNMGINSQLKLCPTCSFLLVASPLNSQPNMGIVLKEKEGKRVGSTGRKRAWRGEWEKI